MYNFIVRIAGVVFNVQTIYARSRGLCTLFFSQDRPQEQIAVSQEEIEREHEAFVAMYSEETDPWDGFLEFTILFSKISEGLIDFNAFSFHGAVVAVNGSAYLFTAPSGTGKTTHIMKWLERCPGAFVVNGDKPFIKFNDDGTVLACGSPWAGKENMYTNTMVPLKAIVLMERAEDNSIERISFAEAFPKLLEQTYRPEDPDKMRKTLKLMQRLNPAVSFWRFKFNNMKDDCFDVAYNALVGQDQ